MTSDRIERRKQRWRDFYEGRGPRFMFLIDVGDPMADRPRPAPENRDGQIDCALRYYERRCGQLAWLDDDMIPYLDMHTGTEIFAEAFGCRVHQSPDSTPFALPMIHDASQVSGLRVPKYSSSTLIRQFEVADELRRRAGDDVLMRVPDIQSPIDIAALIWDKNEFFPAMVEHPEAVKELAAKVTSLFCGFLDAWFARYGREFLAHYPRYYMPLGITLSEDEAGAVGCVMFEEFFLPELVELSNRYGRMGIHCCAHARHQWELFKRVPNLVLMNLHPSREILQEAWSCFAEVCPQMHPGWWQGPPEDWPRQIPAGARAVFEVTVENEDRAREVAEQLNHLRDTVA